MSVRGGRVALSLATSVVAVFRPGWGQQTADRATHRAGWEIAGAWFAAAPRAAFLTRVGTRHHQVYVFGLRAERPLVQGGAVELYHAVDVVPLAASTSTPFRYEERSCSGPTPSDSIQPSSACPRQVPQTGTVYGFGLALAGLEVRYPARRTFRIVAGAAVGALYFTRAMPDPMAARLNFSIAGDAGVRFPVGRDRSIDARYRFQHISNAGLARVNPGLNAHMIRLGLAVR